MRKHYLFYTNSLLTVILRNKTTNIQQGPSISVSENHNADWNVEQSIFPNKNKKYPTVRYLKILPSAGKDIN
jgi:hypothetical protein